MGPRQLLKLDETIVRIDPNEFVGARDVRVDRLQTRVSHQTTNRGLRALGSAEGRVRRRRRVGTHRQLLNGQFNVFQSGTRPRGGSVPVATLTGSISAISLCHRGRQTIVLGNRVQLLRTVSPMMTMGRRASARMSAGIGHARVSRRTILVRRTVTRALDDRPSLEFQRTLQYRHAMTLTIFIDIGRKRMEWVRRR